MNEYEKLFVPYKESLYLKELGFDEPCFMYYRPEMNGSMQLFYHQDNYALDAIGSSNSDNAMWVDCTALLYQQAFDFLREKYNFHSYVHSFIENFEVKCYYFEAMDVITDTCYDEEVDGFNTYEQARLACLIDKKQNSPQ
jgi:hypothetical protein